MQHGGTRGAHHHDGCWTDNPCAHMKRPACLQGLLERSGCPAASLSEQFEDGLALLCVAEQRGLEGVVSKRRDAPSRSGECRDWRKVKTQAWRDAMGAMASVREGTVAALSVAPQLSRCYRRAHISALALLGVGRCTNSASDETPSKLL